MKQVPKINMAHELLPAWFLMYVLRMTLVMTCMISAVAEGDLNSTTEMFEDENDSGGGGRVGGAFFGSTS